MFMVSSFHRCCTTAAVLSLTLLLWTIGPSDSFRTPSMTTTTHRLRPPLLVTSVMSTTTMIKKKAGAVLVGRRGAASSSWITTTRSTPGITRCRPAALLTALSSSTNPPDDQPQAEEDKKADTSPTTNDIRNAATAASQSLDPLFTAVTKMDATTATAKTIPLPLWGDLILDRSLFYLLPVAAFGLIGLVASIIVLFNSTDDFATAITDARTTASAAAAAAVSDDDSSLCRGLCSNPNNVEGLRQYMMGISGQGGR